MNSCYFKQVFLLKNLQQEHAVKFQELHFVSTCTVDLTPCDVIESKIHVKSCRLHMKSCELKKLKKAHIDDLLTYFSLCMFTPILFFTREYVYLLRVYPIYVYIPR